MISHPATPPRTEHIARSGVGKSVGEGARGSAPSLTKPPTVRCEFRVDLWCCNDFRRFSSAHEAAEFAAEHHGRYHS